ncbi:substrate-binding domain-containing protein [Solimicrobium silvestre]|uniref:ABC-type sugar transport system periplasmic component n=1 Tax=Solimicrobium silvestre TaxID=2099400 RepID=A0A2S9H3U9_9BURK|nr:substrate-binding domain-containing protein [Solimicrobium silvestre]PRC94648.1 ABC-type sugar transport system periplasmic component [Solimicrobium silvestre]
MTIGSFLKNVCLASTVLLALSLSNSAIAANKQIVYISAKSDLPFWKTIGKGVKSIADANGYSYLELDSNLNSQTQLKNAQEAIAKNVAGIVISPIDSKTAPEVLALAMKAKIPVVIADVGTNGGEYASYIKSDNYRGAYDVGVVLATKMKDKGWSESPFAMITISLARKNGQDRSNGFRDALKDAGITKETGLRQMQTYSAEETFKFTKEILETTPGLRGLFIETDQPVTGAMQAIKAAKRTGEILIVSFDAMPEVAELLKSDALIAVGMQQPYLMGSKAAEALFSSMQGVAPAKQILIPILVGTGKNITQLMPTVSKTVFGGE